MLRIARPFTVLALVLLAAGTAAAQNVVPGCLQPDRGLVRIVPGVQACQSGEVGVALQLRQAPASLPLAPGAGTRQALPAPPASPGAAMATFFGADRASANLGAPLTRTSSPLALPAHRTLATIGPALAGLR
jgi:hypothetical protein